MRSAAIAESAHVRGRTLPAEARFGGRHISTVVKVERLEAHDPTWRGVTVPPQHGSDGVAGSDALTSDDAAGVVDL